MILLDTCVISEVLRPNPSPNVIAWLDSVPEEQVHLPTIVLGELEKGVELLPDGAKRTALRVWIEQLRQRFQERIVSFDEETAVRWGDLAAEAQTSGHPLPVIDALIAATALQHAALLATRNVVDFRNTGVEIVNPWEGKTKRRCDFL